MLGGLQYYRESAKFQLINCNGQKKALNARSKIVIRFVWLTVKTFRLTTALPYTNPTKFSVGHKFNAMLFACNRYYHRHCKWSAFATDLFFFYFSIDCFYSLFIIYCKRKNALLPFSANESPLDRFIYLTYDISSTARYTKTFMQLWGCILGAKTFLIHGRKHKSGAGRMKLFTTFLLYQILHVMYIFSLEKFQSKYFLTTRLVLK